MDPEKLSIKDDTLLNMPHLFEPYSPFSYLITFENLHKGLYKIIVEEKQNKNTVSGQDHEAVKVYICMKKSGKIEFE